MNAAANATAGKPAISGIVQAAALALFVLSAHFAHVKALQWAGLLTVFLIVLTRLATGGETRLHQEGFLSLYAGPGLQSTFLVLGAAFVQWLYSTGRLGRRTRAIGLIVLLALAALTFNRMALIVLPVLATIPFALKRLVPNARSPGAGRRLLPIAAGFAVALTLLAGAVTLTTAKRIGAPMSVAGVEAAIGHMTHDVRFDIWRYWIAVAEQRPLIGNGYGKPNGNASHLRSHPLYASIDDPDITHPHNLLLSLWVQTGLIGLALS